MKIQPCHWVGRICICWGTSYSSNIKLLMNFLKINIATIKKNIKFDFKDKIKNYKFFEKKT